LKALPGFDGPAKDDSPRLGSRIQEEPKSCSLPYGKKNKLFKFEGPYKSGRYVVLGSSTFVCMRKLTKVEDMLLFWDLPLL